MTARKAPERGRLDSSVWRLLTQPLASSQPPEEYRRRAPLLSALLLVLMLMTSIRIWVALTGDGLQTAYVITMVGFVSAYVLSRTRFYALAAVLTLIMLALPSYVSALTDADHGEIAVRAHLVWLVLPVLLSSVLLSIRGTIVVIAINLVAILALPLLDPELSLRAVLGSFGFYITTSALVIAFMFYRNRLEQLRQAKLSESESRYRSLFEASPISLWEEDFSGVREYLEGLRTAGVSDFRTYLVEHPEAVAHCVDLVEILGVNQATLDLFGVQHEVGFGAQLGEILGYDGLQVFREELLALIEGRIWFRSESLQRTLAGDELFDL